MIKLQCWMYVFTVKKITAMYTTILEKEGCGESNQRSSYTNLQSYNAIYTGQIAEAVRQTLKG